MDAVYPDMPTDETKGGSEEEDDDLYTFDALRSVGDPATEPAFAAAVQDVAGIQVNEIALVRRSDEKWRYARLVKKNEDGMRFVVDRAGQTKVYSQQWYSEVRRLPQLDISKAQPVVEATDGCCEQ